MRSLVVVLLIVLLLSNSYGVVTSNSNESKYVYVSTSPKPYDSELYYVNEGEIISIDVSIIDPNNVFTETLVAKEMPLGATFLNNVFKWTPTSFQSGFYGIKFISQDSVYTVFKKINIIVSNIIFTKEINSSLELYLTAVDPDEDKWRIVIKNPPANSQIVYLNNDQLGPIKFMWTPDIDQVGSHLIHVYVEDVPLSGDSLRDEVDIKIEVIDEEYYEIAASDINKDGVVNEKDFSLLSKHWMKNIDQTIAKSKYESKKVREEEILRYLDNHRIEVLRQLNKYLGESLLSSNPNF